MYNEQIKEILMNTYEVCAHTLDIGSSTIRGNKLYFYTLDKDCENEILSLRNVLDFHFSKGKAGRLNELKQLFPKKKRNYRSAPVIRKYSIRGI